MDKERTSAGIIRSLIKCCGITEAYMSDELYVGERFPCIALYY